MEDDDMLDIPPSAQLLWWWEQTFTLISQVLDKHFANTPVFLPTFYTYTLSFVATSFVRCATLAEASAINLNSKTMRDFVDAATKHVAKELAPFWARLLPWKFRALLTFVRERFWESHRDYAPVVLRDITELQQARPGCMPFFESSRVLAKVIHLDKADPTQRAVAISSALIALFMDYHKEYQGEIAGETIPDAADDE